MEKKRRFKIKPLDIVMGTVLIVGLLVLAYPFVTNAMSSFQQTRVVNEYRKKINTMPDAKREGVDKWIREHNRSLRTPDQPIDHGAPANVADPFVSNKKATKNDVTAKAKPNAVKTKVGEVIGVLEVPKIDEVLPIYSGTNVYQLQNGVGLVEGTSIPFKQKGIHSVLAGHRGLPTASVFRYLDKLKKGDYFFVEENGHRYAYKVNDIRIVSPKEATKFEIDKDKNYVSLLTCTPYMVNSHRLVVRGYQVPMPEGVKSGWPWWTPYLIGFLAIILTALARYLYRRHQIKQDISSSG
ncbi:class C sortase [Periweissella cryptocerci]|uniref:Class C sortase n=1 Tax=Periweissella cryptocerci TaxID=2506420 RepID=A0A4P6YUF4_9LACO|nr:class C sortase [Periweissella cryptocerci]QBO36370.1 class C sortase [Periweissella cryptocerci]